MTAAAFWRLGQGVWHGARGVGVRSGLARDCARARGNRGPPSTARGGTDTRHGPTRDRCSPLASALRRRLRHLHRTCVRRGPDMGGCAPGRARCCRQSSDGAVARRRDRSMSGRAGTRHPERSPSRRRPGRPSLSNAPPGGACAPRRHTTTTAAGDRGPGGHGPRRECFRGSGPDLPCYPATAHHCFAAAGCAHGLAPPSMASAAGGPPCGGRRRCGLRVGIDLRSVRRARTWPPTRSTQLSGVRSGRSRPSVSGRQISASAHHRRARRAWYSSRHRGVPGSASGQRLGGARRARPSIRLARRREPPLYRGRTSGGRVAPQRLDRPPAPLRPGLRCDPSLR
jgi:hypothetical protein